MVFRVSHGFKSRRGQLAGQFHLGQSTRTGEQVKEKKTDSPVVYFSPVLLIKCSLGLPAKQIGGIFASQMS